MNSNHEICFAAAEVELERRLSGLAKSKSRLELINRLLISLSSVAGLDSMVEHILNVLMQTIGAANVSIFYRLDGAWQFRDIYGTSRMLQNPDDPDVVSSLYAGEPLRIRNHHMQVPYPSESGFVDVENWIFPLLSRERQIGAVCMEGVQLTDTTIFDELQPFFIYASLMLDNEISNYTLLAQAHQRLQDSENLYRTLFEQSPDGIVLWSMPDLKPLQFNDTVCRQLGYTREEFARLTVSDFDVSLNSEGVAGRLDTLRRDGSVSFETVHCTKSGEQRHILVSSKAVNVSGSQMILAIHRDITSVKCAEKERLKLEQQLLHTQKLESLGVLAGGIAHDFNNILTTIIGNTDLALMRLNLESPAVDNLQRIEKAASRAADLAKQMLAYSGKGKFVVERLDLNRLVEEMLHMLEVSISKKAVLRLDLHQPLPIVEADATQLRQVVMNLVINASEAIGDKSGVISVATGSMKCDREYLKEVWVNQELEQGLYVFLEISDNGCGMDKDTLARIFDPFFTTKFTGRGLGMAAVLGIVRGHKGAIKVYSEPGRGSSFKILLPACGDPAEIQRSEQQNDEWRGSGMVLLVDDEETIRDIGAEMLKELGFGVITASDGRQALDIYRKTPGILFVVLDLTMPHMDGEQCFRELRQICPDVRVLLSSGFSENEVTQKFAGKGLAGFVQKPYSFSALREAVGKI